MNSGILALASVFWILAPYVVPQDWRRLGAGQTSRISGSNLGLWNQNANVL